VDRGTIAVAGIAVLIVAALAYPRHPSAPGTDDDAAASQPAAVAASTVAPRDVSAPSKKTPAPRPQKSRIAESTKSAMPLAAVKPVAESASAENTAPKASGHDASARSAAAVEPTGTAGIAPITITGCLEVSVDHDEFRLTDTDGVDAPTSRSWKSGFLKKRPATVALLEPPARLALGDVLLRTNQTAEAVSELKAAIALEPKMREAYTLLGKAQQKLGLTKEAEVSFKKAQELIQSEMELRGELLNAGELDKTSPSRE
jgi:tetratricopeptide (TPR) repeat protein